MKLTAKIELKLENSTDANLVVFDKDGDPSNDVGGKLVFKEGTFPEDWRDGDEVVLTVSNHVKHEKVEKEEAKEKEDVSDKVVDKEVESSEIEESSEMVESSEVVESEDAEAHGKKHKKKH